VGLEIKHQVTEKDLNSGFTLHCNKRLKWIKLYERRKLQEQLIV
jgi:hypothetical protein